DLGVRVREGVFGARFVAEAREQHGAIEHRAVFFEDGAERGAVTGLRAVDPRALDLEVSRLALTEFALRARGHPPEHNWTDGSVWKEEPARSRDCEVHEGRTPGTPGPYMARRTPIAAPTARSSGRWSGLPSTDEHTTVRERRIANVCSGRSLSS